MKKLWQTLQKKWQKVILHPKVEPLLTVFGNTAKYYQRNRMQRMGAALAYYTIFSLPAVLIIVIAIVGFLLGSATVQDQIYTFVETELLPNQPDAISQIKEAAQSLNSRANSGNLVTTIVGISFLIFIATNIFYVIQDNLNRIFEVKLIPNKIHISNQILNRVLSFIMIISIGGLIVASTILGALLLKITDWVTENQVWILENLPDSLDFLRNVLPYFTDYFLVFLNLGVSIGLMGLFFAIIYKLLPAVNLGWKYVAWSAFLMGLLFWLGQILLGIYLSKATVISAYGAAGSLIILLIWVYYSAQLVFIGAGFIKAMYDYRQESIEPKKIARRWYFTEDDL